VEFGKLDDINGVNWNLPENDQGNKKRLIPNENFKLYFGSPAWGNRHWVGKLYPLKSRPEDFLYHYSRSFNCIELNTTHYRIPTPEGAREWLTQVPADFEFCPKLHKDISHARNGLVDKTTLSYWFSFLQTIQNNLGPCFIQLHEMFSYTEKAILFQFLENWPNEFELSLELRHPSWFEKGKILPALADYLHKRKIGLVVTDVAGRRDVLHSSLSTPWCMIRLIGNDLDPSDKDRVKMWARRITEWKELGLTKAYVFLHQPDDILTIEFSQLSSELFKEAGFSQVPSFKLQEVQGSLI
jgi:uncharacterized protein YecE (DUF72 family)